MRGRQIPFWFVRIKDAIMQINERHPLSDRKKAGDCAEESQGALDQESLN